MHHVGSGRCRPLFFLVSIVETIYSGRRWHATGCQRSERGFAEVLKRKWNKFEGSSLDEIVLLKCAKSKFAEKFLSKFSCFLKKMTAQFMFAENSAKKSLLKFAEKIYHRNRNLLKMLFNNSSLLKILKLQNKSIKMSTLNCDPLFLSRKNQKFEKKSHLTAILIKLPPSFKI